MSVSSRLTWALLAGVLAANVYRAATQSIIIDEAFTYQHFVGVPFYLVMTTGHTNHHVLYNLLAKVSTGVFGISELTLRIPSLLSGLIYLLAVRAIVFYAFSTEWAVAAFALLSLNPFILDYLIAARGYGLALSLLISALWFFLRSAWYPAGICLGLTLAANLGFLFPVMALGGIVALTQIKEFGRFLERVLVPATVVAFVVNIGPLTHTKPELFFSGLGVATLKESLESFVFLSFMRNPPPYEVDVTRVADVLAALTFAGSTAGAVYFLLRKTRTRLEELMVLNGGCMAGSFAILWVLHMAMGLEYPFVRTGVYWAALLTLGGVALADRFVRRRVLRWTALLASGLCLILFLRGFELGYFQEWQYDAGAKRIATLILRKGGRGRVRIACTAVLMPSLEYYRDRFGAKWEINPRAKANADFRVLAPYDFTPGMHVQYRDPVSDVVVLE